MDLIPADLQGGEGQVVKGEHFLTAEVFQGNAGAGREHQQLHAPEFVFRQAGTAQRLLQQLVQRRTAVSRHILLLYQRIVRGVKNRERKSIREKSDG